MYLMIIDLILRAEPISIPHVRVIHSFCFISIVVIFQLVSDFRISIVDACDRCLASKKITSAVAYLIYELLI